MVQEGFPGMSGWGVRRGTEELFLVLFCDDLFSHCQKKEISGKRMPSPESCDSYLQALGTCEGRGGWHCQHLLPAEIIYFLDWSGVLGGEMFEVFS